jgi:hypothetical protein
VLPAEIAETIRWVVDSPSMTGAVTRVDGGSVIQ